MEGLEEGEIFDSPTSDNELEKPEQKTSSGYSVFERKDMVGHSSTFENKDSKTTYRTNKGGGGSSSDSNSDAEEELPLWKQKKHNFLKKSTERQMDTRSSPTLPEYTSSHRPTSSEAGAKKKNNIWGSVLEEQTLTHSLSKSVGVKPKNYIDFDCRTVESYDYRTSKNDSRPNITESENPEKPNPTDLFDKDSEGISGRSIVDYEDTVDASKRNRNRGTKRKAEGNHERKKGGIFDRLGSKKATTITVGEIDVSVDLEKEELVKKIADFLHEPKVELIERVIDTMGKEVAIRIVKMTRDVEHAGGMYTYDGSRKRTPGGVFIQLMKQQPEFTSEVNQTVFKEDIERHAAEKRERRQKRRKLKKKNKKKKTDNGQGQGQKENSHSRSNSNSRSTSPVNNRRMDHDDPVESDSDKSDEERNTRKKTDAFDFEAELAAARKQISEKKNTDNASVEMEEATGGDLDKENLIEDNEMNELDEGDVVDVLVDDACVD